MQKLIKAADGGKESRGDWRGASAALSPLPTDWLPSSVAMAQFVLLKSQIEKYYLLICYERGSTVTLLKK